MNKCFLHTSSFQAQQEPSKSPSKVAKNQIADCLSSMRRTHWTWWCTSTIPTQGQWKQQDQEVTSSAAT